MTEDDARLIALVCNLFDIGLNDTESAQVLRRIGYSTEDVARIKPLIPARQKGAAHG